ncbi:MAG: DUF2493 domain-containing protein, partial [Fibrobacter sp.]|nr:DUF2493 domain-containing protein [Fibrobacter sp.]
MENPATPINSLAVIGSRGFDNYPLLDAILKKMNPGCIVSGGAKGADTLASTYASKNNIPLKIFLPDYKEYGRGAPLVRNKLIVDAADTVLAFWDGYSSGTKFTIDYALQINKKVLFIDFSHPIVRSNIIGEPLDRKEAESKYLSSNNQNSISIERFRVFKEMAKGIDLIDERYAFS